MQKTFLLSTLDHKLQHMKVRKFYFVFLGYIVYQDTL